MRISVNTLIFLIVGLSQVVVGQKNTTFSNQQWIQYYNQTKLSDKWLLGVDGGYRWKDGKQLQYIARIGAGYQVAPRLRLSGGFASTNGYGNAGMNKVEIRTYQELFQIVSDKKIAVTQRFRVEERFFKKVVDGEFTAGHTFNYRLRYQISASIPLFKLSAEDPNKKVSLILSNEIFINAGKEIVYNMVDHNRVVIGPSFQLSKSWTVGISYMLQYAQLNAPASYAQDNVLWYTVKHNINLSKSKK